MNKNFWLPALGAVILGTSSLAFADRGTTVSTQASSFRYVHDDGWRDWRDDGWRREHEWRRDYGPPWRYRYERDYDRWYPRHWHRHWHPAPRWGYYDHPHSDYGRDGVSIILKGHFDD
jgi:hypothetical protein